MYGNIYDYLNYLYNYIKQQQLTIDRLRERVDALEQHNEQDKEQPSIGPIEYKFDQLKVERLDGTLHIGLMPNGSGEPIEQFSVQEGMTTTDDTTVQTIKQEVDHYMQNGVFEDLTQLESEYRMPLDATNRHLIIEDIQKQLDERIQHYISESQQKHGSFHTQDIVAKVRQDVYRALQNFLAHFPVKGDDSS